MMNHINAKILDSAVVEVDKDVTKQIFYYLISFSEKLDFECFKKALNNTIEDLPILKSTFKSGFWKDKWVVLKNFQLDRLLIVHKIDDKQFSTDAYNEFLNYKEKIVLPEKEPPFKCFAVTGKNSGKKLIVFIVHHSLADPVGGVELVKYIAEHYDAVINNKVFAKRRNHRGLETLLRAIGPSKIFKAVRQMSKKDDTAPVYREICPLDYDNTEKGKCRIIDRLEISPEQMKKLKEVYGKYNFTVNDLLLIITAKLTKHYNENLKNPSSHIYLSVGVGLRKYLKKNLLTITNYAGRDEIVLNYNDVDNLDVLQNKFREFKQKPVGICFLIPFLALALLPIKLQKKIWRNSQKDSLIKWSNKAFSTTNIGLLDKFVQSFGDCVEDASFFASFGYSGLPLISASGYKGKISVYFTKHKDSSGLVKKVKNDFEIIFNKIINSGKEL
jgi:NRPS condensation-like uncharacterized protein